MFLEYEGNAFEYAGDALVFVSGRFCICCRNRGTYGLDDEDLEEVGLVDAVRFPCSLALDFLFVIVDESLEILDDDDDLRNGACLLLVCSVAYSGLA